ncbi:MAG: hypothetical protein Fur0018_27150 [Anaerolineales bacterium]
MKLRPMWSVLFGLALLAILAWAGWAVVETVRGTLSQALQPVNNVAQSVDAQMTQVAQVLHPTPTVIPDPVTIVHDVRALARLETVQYTIEKVVTAESGQNFFAPLFGDKLLFVAHGVVIAGVDLRKLSPADLQTRDGALYVTLPPAEIFVATLDNDKSYVYNRDTGLLTRGDINLETTARQAAEQAIEDAAIEDGILEIARQNAETYLERLFRTLGYPTVIFEHPAP